MKNSIKIIGTIAAVGILTIGSYLLGTTQAEPVTKIHTVTEVKEIVPDGYIDTNSGVQRELR